MLIDSTMTKVAFVRCERFGDLLCTMPFILHWGKTFPDTSITLVVSERCAPILPFLTGYDKSLVIPNTLHSRKEIKISTLWKIRRNWKLSFDLAIAPGPNTSSRMNGLLWALKAKQRVSYVKEHWYILSRYLINNPLSLQRWKAARTHQALACLKSVFPEFEEVPESLYPRLMLPRRTLQEFPGLNETLPLLFISVSNNRERSSLGVRGHVEILNALYKEREFRVIVSCMPKERSYAEAVVRQLSMPACVACTEDLGDLLLILNRADLVFVGDGGLMHMAAALDKFQVVLFGKTKVQEWHPLTKKAICLEHPEHVIKIPQQEILKALKEQLLVCRPK